MATITVEITVNAAQQAKIKQAAEFATGGTLTNAETVAVVKRWCVRTLKHETKSYLADERRASGDDSDIDDIPED